MILRDTDISVMYIHNSLGHPSYDVGTLCSAGEEFINKWSKNKPVIHPCFGRSDMMFYPMDEGNEWWRGLPEKNCGIRYTVYQTIGKILDSITVDNPKEEYEYIPPYGTAESPFRLGDFRLYDDGARPPLVMGLIDGSRYSTDDKNITISCFTGKGTKTSLSFDDIYKTNFAALNNVYYGIAIQNQGSKIIKWCTTSAPLTEGGDSSINFPISSLDGEAKYWVYQFLTNVRYPAVQTDLTKAGSFVPFPLSRNASNKQEISIISQWVSVGITARFTPNNIVVDPPIIANISGTITVNNTLASAQEYTDNTIEWWYNIPGRKDPWIRLQGEGYGTIPNFTAPGRTPQGAPTLTKKDFKVENAQMLSKRDEYGGSGIVIFKSKGKEIARGTFFLPLIPPQLQQ